MHVFLHGTHGKDGTYDAFKVRMPLARAAWYAWYAWYAYGAYNVRTWYARVSGTLASVVRMRYACGTQHVVRMWCATTQHTTIALSISSTKAGNLRQRRRLRSMRYACDVHASVVRMGYAYGTHVVHMSYADDTHDTDLRTICVVSSAYRKSTHDTQMIRKERHADSFLYKYVFSFTFQLNTLSIYHYDQSFFF